MPKTGPEVRYLGDMQRLEMRPGDLFVLALRDNPTEEQVARIKEFWEANFGPGSASRLMILGDGAKIGVIGRAEADAITEDGGE